MGKQITQFFMIYKSAILALAILVGMMDIAFRMEHPDAFAITEQERVWRSDSALEAAKAIFVMPDKHNLSHKTGELTDITIESVDAYTEIDDAVEDALVRKIIPDWKPFPVKEGRISRTVRYTKAKDNYVPIKVWSWKGNDTIRTDQLFQTICGIISRMTIVPDDPNIARLVMETIATESHRGKHVRQMRGPAKGIVQMEPATHDDLVSWLKNNHVDVWQNLMLFYEKKQTHKWNTENNVPYNIALCLCLYWRKAGSLLPDITQDASMRAVTYKIFYGSVMNACTISKYLQEAETFASL
jgi:hypothetical protein